MLVDIWDAPSVAESSTYLKGHIRCMHARILATTIEGYLHLIHMMQFVIVTVNCTPLGLQQRARSPP